MGQINFRLSKILSTSDNRLQIVGSIRILQLLNKVRNYDFKYYMIRFTHGALSIIILNLISLNFMSYLP